jgi:nitrite reductase/ring-hydroxylating ferredoxin subunit
MGERLDCIDVCDVGDVSPDVPHKAQVGDTDVAVFEIEGRYYVTQDLCTHGPGLLSEGYVEGDEVECPFHQGRFNIRTGEATAPPCTEPLETWEVIVKGQRICAIARSAAALSRSEN